MRALALALLLALAAVPAPAQTPPYPALHDVTGVASGDVLNVRGAPGTDGEIIGTLAPDASDVEIVAATEDGTWGRVNVGERSGWASLRFLARQPGQDWYDPPAVALCFGTEPFWSLRLAGDPGFTSPVEDLSIDPPEYVQAAGRLDPWAMIVQTEHGAMQSVVTRERCNDGMADTEYGLSITLINREEWVLTGCCTLAAP